MIVNMWGARVEFYDQGIAWRVGGYSHNEVSEILSPILRGKGDPSLFGIEILEC